MHHIHTIHGTFGPSSSPTNSNPNGVILDDSGFGSRPRPQSMFVPSTHVATAPSHSRSSSHSYGTVSRGTDYHRPQTVVSNGTNSTASSTHASSRKHRVPQPLRTSLSAPKPFVRPGSAGSGVAKTTSHRTSMGNAHISGFPRPEYTTTLSSGHRTRLSSLPPSLLPVKEANEAQHQHQKSNTNHVHWGIPLTRNASSDALVAYEQERDNAQTDLLSPTTRPASSSSLSSLSSTSSSASSTNTDNTSNSDDEEEAKQVQVEKERSVQWRYIADVILHRSHSQPSLRKRGSKSGIGANSNGKGTSKSTETITINSASGDSASESDAKCKASKTYVKSGLSRVAFSINA